MSKVPYLTRRLLCDSIGAAWQSTTNWPTVVSTKHGRVSKMNMGRTIVYLLPDLCRLIKNFQRATSVAAAFGWVYNGKGPEPDKTRAKPLHRTTQPTKYYKHKNKKRVK
jgi:hypothetical protein